jgi:DNA-binding XRE family transcriptional regulator
MKVSYTSHLIRTKENNLRKNNLCGFVGSNIRAFRSKLGLTQEELGERIGIRKRQMIKHELGHAVARASQLRAYAGLFNENCTFPAT